MHILMIGGTRFVGRHLVEAALKRGHTVTIFHRGQSGASLFPELEHVLGDRDGSLTLLKGRKFDRVIDSSGYVPRVVKQSVDLLRDATEHYLFISTISVYKDNNQPTTTESSELLTIENPTVEEITAETYGALKVLCEKVASDGFPGRAFQARCGFLVGPYDYTDRLSSWLERFSRREKVVCPKRDDQPAQLIDMRDLAEWLILMSEKKTAGAFNCTGLDQELLLPDLISTCRHLCNPKAEMVWIDHQFLVDQKLTFKDLPYWMDDDKPPYQLMRVDCGRAQQAGLKYRPLEDTIRDTRDWTLGRPEGERRSGLTAVQEEELLLLWSQMRN